VASKQRISFYPEQPVRENKVLHQQHEIDAAQLLQLQTMHAENQQLRNLLALPQRAGFTTQPQRLSLQNAMCLKENY